MPVQLVGGEEERRSDSTRINDYVGYDSSELQVSQNETESTRLVGKYDLAPGIRLTASRQLDLLAGPQRADLRPDSAVSGVYVIVRDVVDVYVGGRGGHRLLRWRRLLGRRGGTRERSNGLPWCP